MPPKRATRKRQAKLAFSPVSASSPAAAALSPQVRQRAAVVAVAGSPSKRPSKKRKLVQLHDDSDSDAVLPTRKKSFQANNCSSPDKKELKRSMMVGMPVESQKYGMFGGADDEDVLASSDSSDTDVAPEPPSKKAKGAKTTTRQTRQTRSKPDSPKEDAAAVEEPPKKRTRQMKQTKLVKEPAKRQTRLVISKKQAPPADESSESEAEEVQVSPKTQKKQANPKSAPTKSVAKAKSVPELPKKQTRLSRSQPAPPPKSEPSEDGSEDEIAPTTRKQSRNAKSKPLPAVKEESSEDDSEEEIVPPTKQTQSRNTKTKLPPAPESDSSEDDSEDEIPAPTQRRRIVNRRKPVPDDEIEQEEEGDSEEIDEAPGRRKRRADSEEQKELREELEFLQSSPPPSRDRLRSGHGKPLNERQKALAALKKRRAGASGSAAPTSSASTPGRKRAVVIDSDDAESVSSLEVIEEEDEFASSGSEQDEDESDVEEFSNGGPSTLPNRKIKTGRTNALEIFQENEGDAEFIDDDPNGVLGEPADLTSIPLEFTAMGRAKPRDLFKYAVEWMVKKKISPAFSSNDEVYNLAFRKLDDEVKGLANSKYSSSAWTPEFTRTLRARPEIYIDEIGTGVRAILDAYCEACNRKSHPATWNVTFTGKPYHKDTLEPLREDSDSSSDSDSDSAISSASESSEPGKDLGYQDGQKRDYDAQGELLPPESKVFMLGVTCKANASMAHTLHHWRHRLYTWVQDYLGRMGHCTPEKLVQRDSWSERRREKAAIKIVDQMEKDGEIRKLHRLYKDQVAIAEAEQPEGRWGGR